MQWGQISRRLGTELLAAAGSLFLALSVIALPALPFAAVIWAEFDRWRAGRCDALVSPLKPPQDTWSSWLRTRWTTRALVRSDLPITLISLVVGIFEAPIAFFGFISGAVLCAQPVLHAVGLHSSVGPFTATSGTEAVLACPLGLALLVATAGIVLGFSRLRDVIATEFTSGDDRDLQAQLRQLRSSRATLTQAFESERRRIERDLHDGAQQDLVGLGLTLGLLEASLQQATPAKLAELVTRCQDQNERALARLRETVRGIHPRELSDLGLAPAIEELVARSPLKISFSVHDSGDAVSSPVASAIYFTVAEALTNVTKHAESAVVDVQLTINPRGVVARVRDNGPGGVDPETKDGSGLRGLRERMRSVGGDVHISSPLGDGTTLTAASPRQPTWDTEVTEEEPSLPS